MAKRKSVLVLMPLFASTIPIMAGTVISPGTISIYSTLQPIGTAILSIIFLSEVPTIAEICCGIMVIVGLFLTVAARDIEEKAKARLQRGSSAAVVEAPSASDDV